MSGVLPAVAQQTQPRASFLVPESGLVATMSRAGEPESSTFERLLGTLESHAAAEADSLSAYLDLAANVDDPVVGLLFQLLTDDEDRHHELLRRLAATIRDGLLWTHSPEALPGQAPRAGGEGARLAASVRELAQHERESARHFAQLARENRDLSGGLFALLLETMASDSEKHERILRFVHKRTHQRLVDGSPVLDPSAH